MIFGIANFQPTSNPLKATPLGLMTSNWEVVNVSDFDGAFEGQMPKDKNSQSLEDILANLKKPKRPKAPPMPELEDSPNGNGRNGGNGGCCRMFVSSS